MGCETSEERMGTDLRNTDAGKWLDKYFDGFCAGNEGNATIRKLELEGTRVQFNIEMRHRHVPFAGVVLYDVSNQVQGSFDAKHPDPRDIKFCIDVPVVGQVCLNLAELAALIVKIAAL